MRNSKCMGLITLRQMIQSKKVAISYNRVPYNHLEIMVFLHTRWMLLKFNRMQQVRHLQCRNPLLKLSQKLRADFFLKYGLRSVVKEIIWLAQKCTCPLLTTNSQFSDRTQLNRLTLQHMFKMEVIKLRPTSHRWHI